MINSIPGSDTFPFPLVGIWQNSFRYNGNLSFLIIYLCEILRINEMFKKIVYMSFVYIKGTL